MPNFKTGQPRQADYDDDLRRLALQLAQVSSQLSAIQTTTTTVTPTAQNVTIVQSGGSGVASVGLSMPPEFSVSNSPIVAPNGDTISVVKVAESANFFFAGPTAGTATTPTFRALVTTDLPSSLIPPSPTFTGQVKLSPVTLLGTTGLMVITSGFVVSVTQPT